MKIICIGRNYIDHAKELNNPVPSEPMVFMKPSTALLIDGKPFYVPNFSRNIHHEIEVVLRISKNGRSIHPTFAHTYYEEIGLGIDLTARDLQDNLKAKGHPWEKAKAFDHSAVCGQFLHKDELEDIGALSFYMTKNGDLVQQGNTKDLIFSFDTLVSHISEYFTLQKGDLIYTGTPAGVGPIAIGDQLVGYLEGQVLLTCEIK